MKYKLVIFDLDGTIADTSPGILNSIRYTQKKMKLPEISLEKMYTHIGPPMAESYNRNFGLTGEKLNQAVGYHKEYAIKQGYKELKLYDGIVDLLVCLRQNRIKTAVATLKAHSTTIKIFENLGIIDKFDIIKGVDAINPRTKAQLLDDCITESKFDKRETVLIGDSKYDAIGAESVGIDFIAVTYGFGFKTAIDLSDYKNIGFAANVKNLISLLKD